MQRFLAHAGWHCGTGENVGENVVEPDGDGVSLGVTDDVGVTLGVRDTVRVNVGVSVDVTVTAYHTQHKHRAPASRSTRMHAQES